MSASIRLALAIILFSAATSAAQDALATARNLYASAEYEEALTALGRLTTDAPASAIAEIDRYRVLCLMALGRATEADKVIASIVSNDPFYEPAAADAGPRVRAAFSAVRQRMLPGVARNFYVEAKAAFDRKAYPEAASGLEKTLKVIDSIEGASRTDLGDLRVLATGFLDLSRASIPPVVAAPVPGPPIEGPASTAMPIPAPPPTTTNLVVLKQDLPPLPFSLVSLNTGEYRGVIELDIDQTGRVTSARMLESVHVLYDPLLLKVARDWKYEPPRVAGKPSASRKRVEIVLRP
jgi:TonB family protein